MADGRGGSTTAFQGVRTGISFGTYSEVSLAVARERRAEAWRQVAEKLDPSQVRQAAKRGPDVIGLRSSGNIRSPVLGAQMATRSPTARAITSGADASHERRHGSVQLCMRSVLVTTRRPATRAALGRRYVTPGTCQRRRPHPRLALAHVALLCAQINLAC